MRAQWTIPLRTSHEISIANLDERVAFVADVRAIDRYNAVLLARRQWAVEAGLDPDVIEQMYKLLIGHFIDAEMKELGLVKNGQP